MADPDALVAHVAPFGTVVGLCVLVDFPDMAGTVARADVDDFCNEIGYTGFRNKGSVRDYFHDVSGGRLSYTNVVVGYFTAVHDRAYYTDPDEDFGFRARQLVREALDHVKGSGFDFDRLSADSAKMVYALNIFYAGERGNYREGLWPHQDNLRSPYQIGDPPPFPGAPPPPPKWQFFDYQITDIGTELSLGTFCHENGHMVCSFPDLYHRGEPRHSNGAGNYCLMAFGGNANPKNPVQVSGYLKRQAGWTARERTILNGDVLTVEAAVNDFVIHARSSTEYFLIENRQQRDRDASLPDAGLVIWHVDEHGSNDNEQMTANQHFELSLEQADGRFDLELTTNDFGDLGDLFGAPAMTFGELTVPDSNWWDGTRSLLDIVKIDKPGPSMTVTTRGRQVFAVADFGVVADGWQVTKHPRFAADLTGDGRADIIGFADSGVAVALNRGDGTFEASKHVLAAFGFEAGGWRVESHPRYVTKLTGHGGRDVADIIGFGDNGVWVALNNGDGTFADPHQASIYFGTESGGYRVDRHPRIVADLTGDGTSDIVAFADNGTWVSLNNGDGTFRDPQLVIDDFGYEAGGWRVDQHLRYAVDITGDGTADIVGFGRDEVMVALNNGDGTFGPAHGVLAHFGFRAGNWRIDRHPRFLCSLRTHADGRTPADIIGFHDAGGFVALNNGDGTFAEPQPAIPYFGVSSGWRVSLHPRFMADLTGDGTADVLGFFEDGVHIALNNGDGTFQPQQRAIDDYGNGAGGWHVDRHPRVPADINGDGRADIVGFGNLGVWVSINNGDATF